MRRDAAAMLDRAREATAAAATLANLAAKVRREAVLAAVDAHMSQPEIARRLGISQERMSEIINSIADEEGSDEPRRHRVRLRSDRDPARPSR